MKKLFKGLLVFAFILGALASIGRTGELSANESAKQNVQSEVRSTRSIMRAYPINEVISYNGIWQLRSNALVPVGFNWSDNGIPLLFVDFSDAAGNKLPNQMWNGSQKYFTLNASYLNAIGPGMIGTGGLRWVGFNTMYGRIWLHGNDAGSIFYKY